MKTMKISLAVLALMVLAACDWLQKLDLKKERQDGQYQSAMADYAAGRIDAAIKGFNRALRSNPGNASARFQLASLLQDSRSDFLGAIAEYREYLRQEPSSDKASLARERLAMCERLLEHEIARKMSENRTFVKDAEDARADADRKAAEITKLKNSLEKASERIAALEKQIARQRRFTDDLRKEEGGEARPVVSDDVRALLDDEGEEEGDRFDFKKEEKELAAQSERDEVRKGSSLLPAKQDAPDGTKPSADNRRDTLFGGKKNPSAAPAVARPASYVVQEGDTLYKIALKFYNRASAWREIREANKTVISTDGRIKAGQTIKLP